MRKRKLYFGSGLLLFSLVMVWVISACGEKGEAVNGPARVVRYTLYVREGYVTMPDEKKIWMFGFTDNPHGPLRFPAPPIVAEVGDEVHVTLVNDKDPTKTESNPQGDGHTIHLHGLDLPSEMDGDPMVATTGRSVPEGKQFDYVFTAKHAGTYWYHCHEEAPEHVQMGMYGPLIIYPKGQPNRAYENAPTFDKDYTFLLSEIDSNGHDIAQKALHENGSDFDWTKYQPDYFLINGKAWPETMMDPTTNVTGVINQTVLIRLINGGYQVHALHTHGFHFQVIGTDGRKLDVPYWKDTILIGPGERYDILIKLDQLGRYMVHDHVEPNITNAGAYIGGMVTMINVNRPDGSNPVPMPAGGHDD